MSSSSNRKSSKGQYTKLGDKITKVAANAIREAVQSSNATKSATRTGRSKKTSK